MKTYKDVYLVQMIPVFVFFPIIRFLRESPFHLASSKNFRKLTKTLKKIARTNNNENLMLEKQRTKEINMTIKYFIETNYPIQNIVMLFERESDISDQKKRIYGELMSDESLMIDELGYDQIEVKSQINICTNNCDLLRVKSVDFDSLKPKSNFPHQANIIIVKIE